jgi:hypothetical protein
MPNVHKRTYDDAFRAEVVELYRSGCFNYPQLKERFGISLDTINKIIQEAGACRGRQANMHNFGKGKIESRRAEVQTLIETLPAKLAAKKLGHKTTAYVHKLRRRWGTRKPPTVMVDDE